MICCERHLRRKVSGLGDARLHEFTISDVSMKCHEVAIVNRCSGWCMTLLRYHAGQLFAARTCWTDDREFERVLRGRLDLFLQSLDVLAVADQRTATVPRVNGGGQLPQRGVQFVYLIGNICTGC